MSDRHRGEFRYWKPNRRLTHQQWSHIAWFIALALTLLVFSYVVGATIVMLTKLPPEVIAP